MTSNGHHHASNGHHHGGRNILVLYKIVNSESDGCDPLFNAFQMPYGSGPTLSAVKRNFVASHALSHLGPEGYHWRVLVEDKPGATGADRTFSWWDVQDGNAKLPVKQASQYQLRKLLNPPKPDMVSSSDTAAKAAKGAFKMMGKAMASAVGSDDLVGTSDTGPPVSVLTFKLLDLVKLHDDANLKNGGGQNVSAPPPRQPRAPRPAPAPKTAPAPRVVQQQPPRQQPQHHAAPQRRAHQPAPTRQQQPVRGHAPAPQQQRQPQRQQEASLMDFGESPAANPKVLNHAVSSPAAFGAAKPNESRPERLKRERLEKERKSKANRVWDDVDQRWVEVDPKTAINARSTQSAPPGANSASIPKKKNVVGIKLDTMSAVGKSQNVQAAVNKRVNEMQENQEKALKEVREREAKKKKDEEDEDQARKQLEPKIKAWSEEHGKKKQLRALLASLHTILWPGAKWKQISIGDVLHDGKVKKFFHKATLVVHPDKTGHLPADQRFLAKRIFDALCQAKTDFDNGAK